MGGIGGGGGRVDHHQNSKENGAIHRIHKWRPTWVELAAKHDIEAFYDKHAVFLRREGENERSTCGKLHSWFFFKCQKVIGIKKNDELRFWLKCWNDYALKIKL